MIINNIKILSYVKQDCNNKAIYLCECPYCLTRFESRVNDIENKKVSSCGCLRSLGEQKIAKLLTQANISFKREKTFPTLVYQNTGRKAKFDFYVENKYLIEYDGRQHFEEAGGRYTKEKFED